MISDTSARAVVAHLEALPQRGPAFRTIAMRVLNSLSGYNWSGIYRLEGGELVLAEFDGPPTEHVRIAIGRGVCGTAIAENRNQVVEDVQAVENYLACSAETRAEIVVLIRRGDEVLGQIDADGHEAGAFDASDEAMLEQIAAIVADRWE